MDFKERILRAYPENFTHVGEGRLPMPYYLAYPDYNMNMGDNFSLKDFEYLQQTYPAQTRKYQRKIAEILDKIDYEGSMIYDEYPDKASLIALTDSIAKVIKNDEDKSMDDNTDITGEDVGTIVQILLCDEIYKRRHGRKKTSFIKF